MADTGRRKRGTCIILAFLTVTCTFDYSNAFSEANTVDKIKPTTPESHHSHQGDILKQFFKNHTITTKISPSITNHNAILHRKEGNPRQKKFVHVPGMLSKMFETFRKVHQMVANNFTSSTTVAGSALQTTSVPLVDLPSKAPSRTRRRFPNRGVTRKPGGRPRIHHIRPGGPGKPGGLHGRRGMRRRRPGGLNGRRGMRRRRPGGLNGRQGMRRRRPGGVKGRPGMRRRPGGLRRRPGMRRRPGGLKGRPGIRRRPGGLRGRPGMRRRPGGLKGKQGLRRKRPGRPGMRRMRPGGLKGKPGMRRIRPGSLQGKPGMLTMRPGGLKGKPGMRRIRPEFLKGKPGMRTLRPGGLKGKPGMPRMRPGRLKGKPGMRRMRPGKLKGKPGMRRRRPGGLKSKPGMHRIRKPGTSLIRKQKQNKKKSEIKHKSRPNIITGSPVIVAKKPVKVLHRPKHVKKGKTSAMLVKNRKPPTSVMRKPNVKTKQHIKKASQTAKTHTSARKSAACQKPPSVTNAHFKSMLKYHHGSKITYTCKDGYKLNGIATHICQLDGQWSGDVPTCVVDEKRGKFNLKGSLKKLSEDITNVEKAPNGKKFIAAVIIVAIAFLFLICHCLRVSKTRRKLLKKHKEVLEEGLLPTRAVPGLCEVSNGLLKKCCCCGKSGLPSSFRPQKSRSGSGVGSSRQSKGDRVKSSSKTSVRSSRHGSYHMINGKASRKAGKKRGSVPEVDGTSPLVNDETLENDLPAPPDSFFMDNNDMNDNSLTSYRNDNSLTSYWNDNASYKYRKRPSMCRFRTNKQKVNLRVSAATTQEPRYIAAKDKYTGEPRRRSSDCRPRTNNQTVNHQTSAATKQQLRGMTAKEKHTGEVRRRLSEYGPRIVKQTVNHQTSAATTREPISMAAKYTEALRKPGTRQRRIYPNEQDGSRFVSSRRKASRYKTRIDEGVRCKRDKIYKTYQYESQGRGNRNSNGIAWSTRDSLDDKSQVSNTKWLTNVFDKDIDVIENRGLNAKHDHQIGNYMLTDKEVENGVEGKSIINNNNLSLRNFSDNFSQSDKEYGLTYGIYKTTVDLDSRYIPMNQRSKYLWYLPKFTNSDFQGEILQDNCGNQTDLCDEDNNVDIDMRGKVPESSSYLECLRTDDHITHSAYRDQETDNKVMFCTPKLSDVSPPYPTPFKGKNNNYNCSPENNKDGFINESEQMSPREFLVSIDSGSIKESDGMNIFLEKRNSVLDEKLKSEINQDIALGGVTESEIEKEKNVDTCEKIQVGMRNKCSPIKNLITTKHMNNAQDDNAQSREDENPVLIEVPKINELDTPNS